MVANLTVSAIKPYRRMGVKITARYVGVVDHHSGPGQNAFSNKHSSFAAAAAAAAAAATCSMVRQGVLEMTVVDAASGAALPELTHDGKHYVVA